MQQFGSEKDRTTWAMHYAIVKAAIKQPQKTHEATVKGKTSKGIPYSYTYKYADLADVDKAIMDAIRRTEKDGKPLLSYFFEVDNAEEGVSAETVIIDATNGFMIKTSKVWFKNYNVGDAQKTASLVSYAKRYSLSAAFGIASEDDDDAQNAQQQEAPEVNDAALEVIWNAYINHDPVANNWIHKSHDAVTANKILKLSEDFKKQQAKAKSKRIKELKAKHDQAQKEIKKQGQKSDDEVIKNLVDHDDSDKDEHADQQDLFDQIVGD
ncbi:ERF family protein [Lactobacillus amylovorus]|uniref:ERF family protein n=1 Tax=Lactobacillus amylovorus TaxID=1604 RepID=UPI00232F0E03|nr:ERF family protein [Lactobacillus amylovorus]MDB6232926.1 ERF family protein [Lactobacillus amylovorus]